ncbi:MAG: DUF4340 domain-containing protein [Alphaproteobacteria bacterium]
MQGTLLERMDRETRALVVLAAAALIFVIAAAFALSSSSRVIEPAFEPEPFFPELAHELGAVRELVIETKDETLRIVRNTEGQWVLPEKDSYPVRREPLREILLGIGELTKVRPATSNPEWHKELRLGAPDEGGKATRVTLKRENGAELVTLLVGEKADLPDISGLDSWYVRVPGEMQSWLARGTLSLRLDPSAWIVTKVMPVNAGRIRSATVTPPEGPAYTVARENEESESFTLKTVPEGAVPKGPRVADGVGQAIADLEIRDARLATDFNFENAPTARYRTFDGLEITVRSLKLGEDVWATIEARYDGQPGGDAAKSFDASSLAADINQRVAGYAFLLPDYAGNQMRLPLSELVRETEPAAPPPDAAGPEGEPDGGAETGAGPEGAAAPAGSEPEAEPEAAESAAPSPPPADEGESEPSAEDEETAEDEESGGEEGEG